MWASEVRSAQPATPWPPPNPWALVGAIALCVWSGGQGWGNPLESTGIHWRARRGALGSAPRSATSADGTSLQALARRP